MIDVLDLFDEDDLCPTDVDINIEPHLDNLPIQDAPTLAHSLTYENDPNGDAIVTDIFDGKHHYVDMEQAQTLTDVLSSLPIQTTPSHRSAPCERDLPTDIEDAKEWGDDIWNEMDKISNGVLSLTMI